MHKMESFILFGTFLLFNSSDVFVDAVLNVPKCAKEHWIEAALCDVTT